MNDSIFQTNRRPKHTSRSGGLKDLTRDDITKIVGFEPTFKGNLGDRKVTWEWTFTYYGETIVIWDYKGSSDLHYWSFCGDIDTVEEIFGESHIEE